VIKFCEKHPCALIDGVCPICGSNQPKNGASETHKRRAPLKPKANTFSFAKENGKKKKALQFKP